MKGTETSNFSELVAPNPSEFEFIPDIGFRYVGDGRSVILGCTSLTKEGASFTDPQLTSFGQALQQYFDGIKGLAPQVYKPSKILNNRDFRSYDSKFAYKFVTEETYDSYSKRGSFLLSSLERFRGMEGQGSPAGDRFEGSSFCAYSVGSRELHVHSMSGFDTHIFSFARDLKNQKILQERFGPVVLKITLRPFVQALSACFDGLPTEVRLVRYADLKLHRSHLAIRDIEGFPPNLTAQLARSLRELSRQPAIFAEPCRFEDEREVRIAIRAEQDVAPCTAVEHPSFHHYVERIA